MTAGTKADLHCHTTASDGIYPPSEAVRIAASEGVTHLAITDHDTLEGHAEARAAGVQYGISIIPGIEVSSFDTVEVHVLGYGVQLPELAPRTAARANASDQVRGLRAARTERAQQTLGKLTEYNIHVPMDLLQRLAGDAIIGRPHIARAMVAVGAVANTQEAFDKWIGEGRPCFVAHRTLSPGGAIDLIHQCSGIAILAHPMLYGDYASRLIATAITATVDGLEVYHPSADVAQSAYLTTICDFHGLLATGGSDFHGVPTRANVQVRPGSHVTPVSHLTALLNRMTPVMPVQSVLHA